MEVKKLRGVAMKDSIHLSGGNWHDPKVVAPG